MRYAAGIVLFLLIAFFAPMAFANEGYDVRKVRWGMSKAHVIASEMNSPFRDEEYFLFYYERILGRKCTIAYRLDDRQNLIGVAYTFETKGRQDIYELYQALTAQLDEKYTLKQENVRSFTRIYETNRSHITLYWKDRHLYLTYDDISVYRSRMDRKENRRNSELEQF